MSDFLLDGDGDLALTAGEPLIVDDVAALAQRIAIRLRLFKGDWFLNTREGIPYHEHVLPKRASPGLRREVFRRAIATTPGVKRIISLAVNVDASTRVLSVSGEVQCDDLSTLTFVESPPVFDFGAPLREEAV